MKCVDCPYYWIDDGEQCGRCHYGYNDGGAPCEVVDDTDDDYLED